MNDPASHRHPAPRDPLAPLRGKLPRGWECWTGVAGILYCRRRKTSPPVVFRSEDACDLARMVAEWEEKHQ